jgi:hypothetical protein
MATPGVYQPANTTAHVEQQPDRQQSLLVRGAKSLGSLLGAIAVYPYQWGRDLAGFCCGEKVGRLFRGNKTSSTPEGRGRGKFFLLTTVLLWPLKNGFILFADAVLNKDGGVDAPLMANLVKDIGLTAMTLGFIRESLDYARGLGELKKEEKRQKRQPQPDQQPGVSPGLKQTVQPSVSPGSSLREQFAKNIGVSTPLNSQFLRGQTPDSTANQKTPQSQQSQQKRDANGNALGG